MKKISVLILIILIFNFICSNYVIYASSDPESSEVSGSSLSMSMDDYKKIADEGKVTVGSQERDVDVGESAVGDATSKFGTFISTTALVVVQVISDFTNNGGYFYYESDYAAEKTKIFTINSLIFGEYVIFNTKAYQTSSSIATDPNYKATGINEIVDNLKEKAAVASRIFVQIALMLALPMVLFSIVKTVSAKKAKDLAAWKKILVRWILCVFLLMFYQYIFAIIDTAADSLLDGFWQMRVGLEEAGHSSFEIDVINDILFQLLNSGGVTSLAYAIEFVAIVFMQVLFLIKYTIRTFAILLLFIVAPLVILIHSIRLMLGKESSILGEVFKNYLILVFMQPLHIMFYLVFFFSLSEMAIKVPVLGIILLYALYRAEQIAKAMFGWELSSSIFSRK